MELVVLPNAIPMTAVESVSTGESAPLILASESRHADGEKKEGFDGEHERGGDGGESTAKI